MFRHRLLSARSDFYKQVSIIFLSCLYTWTMLKYSSFTPVRCPRPWLARTFSAKLFFLLFLVLWACCIPATTFQRWLNAPLIYKIYFFIVLFFLYIPSANDFSHIRNAGAPTRHALAARTKTS